MPQFAPHLADSGDIGQFRTNSASFVRLRLVSCDFGQFRPISASFVRLRQVSCDFGKFGAMSAMFRRVRPILGAKSAHVERCWPNLGRLRTLSCEARRLWRDCDQCLPLVSKSALLWRGLHVGLRCSAVKVCVAGARFPQVRNRQGVAQAN